MILIKSQFLWYHILFTGYSWEIFITVERDSPETSKWVNFYKKIGQDMFIDISSTLPKILQQENRAMKDQKKLFEATSK